MSIFKRKPKPQPAAVSDAPVPMHIAIIMDGNGRWAKRRGMPRYAGHAYGAETFRRIANHCRDIGVRYLTVYAFSTENWKRSEEEISAIMRLLGDYLKEALADMDKNRVRFVFFGDLTRLSPELQTLCQQAADRSRQYDGVQVNFCLNYGGRDEILRAARALAQDCLEGRLSPEDIGEKELEGRMYCHDVPPPDLLVRPGGEMRISNFLLWECAYSEFYFTDTLWPDFGREEIYKAIAEFQKRNRRYGGLSR